MATQADVKTLTTRPANSFEAMAYDADCPSMTMRFRVREGEAPLAGGLYRIERIRTLTEADRASFGDYPDPKCYHCGKSDQDEWEQP